MVGTFSFNSGTITEAINYPVQDYLSLTSSTTPDTDLLFPLLDNEEKLINPIALRNAFLSLWTSVPFKETKTTNINDPSYIGVDTLDPIDNDLKRTIFIGKRSFSGTYSYDNSHDIMAFGGVTSSTLLDSEVDIFLYNTKSDIVSNTITRMSILSGKIPSLYSTAPFIQSEKVSGVTESVSIDFVAKSGNLSIGNIVNISNPATGSFNLNGILLPNIDVNLNGDGTYSNAAVDSNVWFWRDGKVVWDELTLPPLDTIGATGLDFNIIGTPVNVNDYSLELDDDRYMPMTIGGLPMGNSFNNISISEVLRGMLYTYLGPLCTISVDQQYYEVGTYPTPTLTYTITKRTENTLPTGLMNMIPGVYAPITTPGQTTITGISSGIVISPIGATSTTFTITVSDGGTEPTSTTSSSVSVQGIYPYFYGFSNIDIIDNNTLNSLTKLVEYKSDKIIDISGSGNYYFVYDSSYGTLSQILDDYGLDRLADFSVSTRTLSKFPWATKEFLVYQWNNVSQIGPPSINYQFKY
jgi:hypothetical protein